jgi:cobalt-zinc-cadmium efflux system membrane fusion protein
MKYLFIYLMCLLTAAFSYGADEHDHSDHPPSPEGFGVARDGYNHEAEAVDHDDHEGHDHAAHEEVGDHEDHSGHDHALHEEAEYEDHESDEHASHEEAEHDDHEGHDHGDSGESVAVALSDEMAAKVGIVVRKAESGQIQSVNIFPAEVALNRTRLYPLTPLYPSVVRELLVEIGDRVTKGQELIRLENRENLAVYVLKAPGSGTVVSKNTSIGESVSDDTVIMEVADLSSVWVEIDIFPQFQHRVKKGQAVRLIATDGHTADTEIAYISPLLSHETRTRKARAVLEQPDEDFMPGAFVRAEIALSHDSEVLRVEHDAVQQLDNEAVVFVPGKDGYIPREVKIGHTGRDYAEIISGLQAGEEYVAEGAFDLKAEMLTSGMDAHAGHGH